MSSDDDEMHAARVQARRLAVAIRFDCEPPTRGQCPQGTARIRSTSTRYLVKRRGGGGAVAGGCCLDRLRRPLKEFAGRRSLHCTVYAVLVGWTVCCGSGRADQSRHRKGLDSSSPGARQHTAVVSCARRGPDGVYGATGTDWAVSGETWPPIGNPESSTTAANSPVSLVESGSFRLVTPHRIAKLERLSSASGSLRVARCGKPEGCNHEQRQLELGRDRAKRHRFGAGGAEYTIYDAGDGSAGRRRPRDGQPLDGGSRGEGWREP